MHFNGIASTTGIVAVVINGTIAFRCGSTGVMIGGARCRFRLDFELGDALVRFRVVLHLFGDPRARLRDELDRFEVGFGDVGAGFDVVLHLLGDSRARLRDERDRFEVGFGDVGAGFDVVLHLLGDSRARLGDERALRLLGDTFFLGGLPQVVKRFSRSSKARFDIGRQPN